MSCSQCTIGQGVCVSCAGAEAPSPTAEVPGGEHSVAWPVPRAAEDAWGDTAATQIHHMHNDHNHNHNHNHYHHLAPVSPTAGGGGGGGEYGEGDGDGAFGEVGAGGNSTCTAAAHVAAAGGRMPARSAMSRCGSHLPLPTRISCRHRLRKPWEEPCLYAVSDRLPRADWAVVCCLA